MQHEIDREVSEPALPSSWCGSGGLALDDEIYLAHLPLMRKIAIRKFGIAPADAENLVHDVFASYLMNAERVQKITPYLVGAMCNACRQYLRRTVREDALFCGEDPCLAAPDGNLLQELERKAMVARVLARIGRRCRDLFERFYFRGESPGDIAAALETTRGTILVFLHKCRERARAAVDRGVSR
jgi:RNA polymerase sigma factor (sigma-70 family)